MIAGIDYQTDIDLYLDRDEIEKLSNSTIEGILIKIHKPKRQGTISISVNDSKKYNNGLGIGLDDKLYWGVIDNFRIDAFIGSELYNELLERGVIGIRQRMRDGSKIHIYDKSKLNSIDALRVEDLEFYRDNKEKLYDYFK